MSKNGKRNEDVIINVATWAAEAAAAAEAEQQAAAAIAEAARRAAEAERARARAAEQERAWRAQATHEARVERAVRDELLGGELHSRDARAALVAALRRLQAGGCASRKTGRFSRCEIDHHHVLCVGAAGFERVAALCSDGVGRRSCETPYLAKCARNAVFALLEAD